MTVEWFLWFAVGFLIGFVGMSCALRLVLGHWWWRA